MPSYGGMRHCSSSASSRVLRWRSSWTSSRRRSSSTAAGFQITIGSRSRCHRFWISGTKLCCVVGHSGRTHRGKILLAASFALLRFPNSEQEQLEDHFTAIFVSQQYSAFKKYKSTPDFVNFAFFTIFRGKGLFPLYSLWKQPHLNTYHHWKWIRDLSWIQNF